MIDRKIGGLVLVALLALGMAACSGDASANGNGEAEAQAEPAQATAADEAGDAAAAMPQEMPDGVTTAMIEEGEGIYNGAGICMSCHGPDGAGIPNLGADLTDDEWLHSDGTYEGILASIAEGVTAQESSSGVPMPAKGGTAITDEQVSAVSAYVWSLSQ
jgi:mono/diheme cytochrome c family protein